MILRLLNFLVRKFNKKLIVLKNIEICNLNLKKLMENKIKIYQMKKSI